MTERPVPPSLSSTVPEDLSCHRRFFSRIGFSLVVLIVVRTTAQLAIEMTLGRAYPWLYEQVWFIWLLSLVPLYVFGLPAMLLTLRRTEPAPMCTTYRQNGVISEKPPLGGGWLVVSVLVSFGLMYIGSIVGNLTMAVYSDATGVNFENPLNNILLNSPVWMTVLGTVIAAPLGEEFIFRKLLIDRARRYGDVIAILISATFFGLVHGNLFQFFYAFMLGAVLGYLYTRTGQLRWSVALHMMINLVGGVLAPALMEVAVPDRLNSDDPAAVTQYMAEHPLAMMGMLLMLLAIMTLMIVAVVLVICLRKYIKLGQGEIELPRGYRASAVLGNAGMMTALAVCGVLMLISLLPF